jgi:hypothetical protein
VFGEFAGDLDGDEGLDDEVGPEEVHDFKGDHHEDHETVGEHEDLVFELRLKGHALEDGADGRHDADRDEEHDAAGAPGEEAVDVETVEHPLAGVLEVLGGVRGTL